MKKGVPVGYVRSLYTVYDNRTDELVCLDAPAMEAARAMRLSPKSFYCIVYHTLKGNNKKWYIEVTKKEDVENE